MCLCTSFVEVIHILDRASTKLQLKIYELVKSVRTSYEIMNVLECPEVLLVPICRLRCRLADPQEWRSFDGKPASTAVSLRVVVPPALVARLTFVAVQTIALISRLAFVAILPGAARRDSLFQLFNFKFQLLHRRFHSP
jgi:hypothetical protein